MKLSIPLRGSLQNPAPSPDGVSISLTRWRGKYNSGRADVFTYNLATHAVTMLPVSGEANVSQPGSCWNERGIIFSTDHWGPDCAAYWDGAALHRLFDSGDDQTWEPSWGNDFYVAERHIGGEGPGQIIKASLVEQLMSDIDELTHPQDDCRQPCVSPDSSMVIYQQRIDGDIWKLVLLDLNNRKRSVLPNGTDATFSHDSKRVVFSNNAGKLLVYDLVKKTLSPVTVETRYSGAPSFSRDDKQIFYEGASGNGAGDDGGPPTSIYVTDAPA